MKDLYNSVTDRLTSKEARAIYVQKGVSGCKFVDLFRGQYLNWEDFDTFPLPAVLFEFTIDHINNTATVTLHLCYEQPMDTSSISRSKAAALKFFDFVEGTKEILTGLEGVRSGKLELSTEEMAKDDAIVNVYLLSYTCSYGTSKKNKYDYTTGNDLEMDSGLRYKLES